MTARFAGRLLIVGCGNMGGAMLGRWIDSGAIEPAQVLVVNRSERPLPAGVAWAPAVPEGFHPDAVMLGFKPQQLDEAAAAIAPRLGHVPLLVSILAGVEGSALARRFDADAIVRAMPNLPVAIGKGVVALQSDRIGDDARRAVTGLMAPLGLVEWIDDAGRFDAVTALEGCGPGFVFRFIDALAAAGAALGIEAEQARRLALATVEGAAAMAGQADVSPAVLADRVASPGGSTREGLNILDQGDALRRLLADTLAASARRNAEMAAAARD